MLTAHRGREPGLQLRRDGVSLPLRDWALEVCDALVPVCEALDQTVEGRPYTDALAIQRRAVLRPDTTPSARMLAEMREHGECFHAFARRKSLEHQQWFARRPVDAARMALMERSAAESLERQRALEAADDRSFEAYLEAYFAQS